MNVPENSISHSSDEKSTKRFNDNHRLLSSTERHDWVKRLFAEEDLTFAAKVVGVILALDFYGKDTGWIFPEYESIAKRAGGMSVRYAKRVVKELEEAGWLSHVRTGKSNRYTLLKTSPVETASKAPEVHSGSLLIVERSADQKCTGMHLRSERECISEVNDSSLEHLLSPSETPSNVIAIGDGKKAVLRKRANRPKGQQSRHRQWGSPQSGTPLPENFDWNADLAQIAKEAGLSTYEASAAFKAFTADARANGKVKANWNEAWRSWCLRAPKTKRMAI
jgi:hypothetical protein